MTLTQHEWADALAYSAAQVLGTFASIKETEWEKRADHSEWSCRGTAAHMADCMLFYALSMSGRSTHPSGYVRVTDPPAWDSFSPPAIVWPQKEAGTTAIVEVLDSTSTILENAIRNADARRLDHHPTGLASPSDFAAMGITELMLHGHDIASALGVPLTFEQQLVTAVLEKIFPHADTSTADPWLGLLTATGRTPHTRGLPWMWIPQGK